MFNLTEMVKPKVDPDTLCLFWDEIEAIFAREIERRAPELYGNYKLSALKSVRKELYKAAKKAANGKPLKRMNLDLQDIEE